MASQSFTINADTALGNALGNAAALPPDYVKAFKDADIRGEYPSQVNEALAYRIACAAVQLFEFNKIIVGRDARVSSPTMSEAFMQGIVDSGSEVIDIGIVDTPAVYFLSGKMNEFGVVITASHNPPEFNGLKLVLPGAIPVTNATGLLKILQLIKDDFKNPAPTNSGVGKITPYNVLEEYSQFDLALLPLHELPLFKVLVDAGNGVGATLREILQKLPIELTELFFELDGTFPNRGSNPTLSKNQTQIREELKKGGYDLGVSMDGDADRVNFFDSDGNSVNSAVIGALLAKYFLAISPNASFVYTCLTSRIYEETILQNGGKAVVARVGHAFIKEAMRREDAIFGCEHSGHFYFKDTYFADSVVFTLMIVLASMRGPGGEKLSLASLVRPLQIYYQTEDTLIRVPDKEQALVWLEAEVTKQTPPPLRIERLDGLSVTFKDYWFTVKPSVTEDALKFLVEGVGREVAEEKHAEVAAMLMSLDDVKESPLSAMLMSLIS